MLLEIVLFVLLLPLALVVDWLLLKVGCGFVARLILGYLSCVIIALYLIYRVVVALLF